MLAESKLGAIFIKYPPFPEFSDSYELNSHENKNSLRDQVYL